VKPAGRDPVANNGEIKFSQPAVLGIDEQDGSRFLVEGKARRYARPEQEKVLAPFGDADLSSPLLRDYLRSDESSTNDVLPAFSYLGPHRVSAS
jgi:hypothetical protein